MSKMAFLFLLLFSTLGHAVESIYLDPSHPLFQDWGMLVQPKNYLAPRRTVGSTKTFSRFYAQSNVLILGDHFKVPESDYSITDLIGPYFEKLDSGANWTRTSFDIPEEMNKTNKGKIHYLRIDYQQRMSFRDDTFDTIVMRASRCVCSLSNCCSQFDLTTPESFFFYFDIARILNKRNNSAVAALQKQFDVSIRKGALDLKHVNNQTKELKASLERVEQIFPQLQISMVYLGVPIGTLMTNAKMDINPKTVRKFASQLVDKNKKKLTRLKAQEIFDHPIPVFDGILFSVKGESSDSRTAAAAAAVR